MAFDLALGKINAGLFPPMHWLDFRLKHAIDPANTVITAAECVSSLVRIDHEEITDSEFVDDMASMQKTMHAAIRAKAGAVDATFLDVFTATGNFMEKFQEGDPETAATSFSSAAPRLSENLARVLEDVAGSRAQTRRAERIMDHIGVQFDHVFTIFRAMGEDESQIDPVVVFTPIKFLSDSEAKRNVMLEGMRLLANLRKRALRDPSNMRDDAVAYARRYPHSIFARQLAGAVLQLLSAWDDIFALTVDADDPYLLAQNTLAAMHLGRWDDVQRVNAELAERSSGDSLLICALATRTESSTR
jgi:hypothetical protein